MKKILLFTVISALTLTGCNEDKFLEEKALDFNSASNSYNTKADFDAATTELYYLTREEFYTTYDRTTDLSKFADMWITADPLKSNITADLSPSGAIAKFYWDENYKLIAQANTVISRVPNATALTDDQKKEFEAKGRFFRALGYRTLVLLYGNVPLQIEEVTAPKTDFTRESKDKVWAQVIEDLEYAAANLPEINAVKDGEISKPAANMLLAEAYLATGANDKAVNAASAVINKPTGEIYVKIANISDKDQSIRLNLKGIKNLTSGKVITLHSDNPIAENSIQRPDAILPIEKDIEVAGYILDTEVPAKTFAVFVLK